MVDAERPADLRRTATAIRLARRPGERARRSARAGPGRDRLGPRRGMGSGQPLDGRAARGRACAGAATARAVDGGGGGVADRGGRGRRAGRDRVDRGRQAPRAPPRRSGRCARGDARRVAAAGTAAHDGPGPPAPRGGPPAPRGAAHGPGAPPRRRGRGHWRPSGRPPTSAAARRRAPARRAGPVPRRSARRPRRRRRRSASGPRPGGRSDGSTCAAKTPARNVSPGPDRIHEVLDRDRRPRPAPGIAARRAGLDRHAASRAVREQHRALRDAGRRASDDSGIPGLDVVAAHAHEVGPAHDRRWPGRPLRDPLARHEDPQQALPAEGDQRVARRDGRPGVRELRGDRPEQPARARRARPPAGRRARPGPTPAARAGCARRASRC